MSNKTLPEGVSRSLLRLKLKAGSIIHIFCDFIAIPDNKFAVVMYLDDDYVLVSLINSKKYEIIERQANLVGRQIELPRERYSSFLNHNSFLNCTQVFDDLDLEYILDHLLRVPDDHKGHLKDEDKVNLIQAVRGCDTISEEKQNLILDSFE